MGDFQQVLHHRQRIGAGIVKPLQIVEPVRDLAAHDFFEQVEHAAAIGQAQHVANRVSGDRIAAFAMRHGLVQQGEGIAGGAFGGAGDQGQGAGLDFHIFFFRDRGQIGGQFAAVYAAQVEALAARQYRHRHFADFCGCENEFHMRWWFFQGLEQAIEGLLGQHVHFVNDIDLVAGAGRSIAHAFDDLADIVNAGAAGGVHLLHIHVAGFGDGDAGIALAAGMDGGLGSLAVRPDAVEGAGDDARRGGLAHAAHAREHEGMGDAARRKRVGQGAHQRLLPDQAGEVRGAVFARQNTVRLGRGAQIKREVFGHGPTITRTAPCGGKIQTRLWVR